MGNTMTRKTPIDACVVKNRLEQSGLEKVGLASIRELVRLVNEIEKETGEKYIRMEMGVPGLPPAQVGIEGEIAALRSGVASKYPMIEGVEILKKEISRFIKNFMGQSVPVGVGQPTLRIDGLTVGGTA